MMKTFSVPALLLLSAVAVAQQSGSGQLLDKIVAVVNDGVVLQSELEAQTSLVIQRLREQATPLPPRDILEQQVLERLVVMRIQLQRAQKLGVRIDDSTLNRALTAVAERNGISFSELPAVLNSQGIDYGAYREEMRREMMIEQLRARDVVGRINVSPGEIEARLRQQAGRDDTIEYRLSHILLATPSAATAEDIAATQARAQQLRERIQSGEDFAGLAVAYSNGAQALEGGDLGWQTLSALPTLFVQIVPKLAVGEVSNPIGSPSGFHLIRLVATRGAEPVMVTQRRARHILVMPNEIVTDEAARMKIIALRERILAGEDFAQLAREASNDTMSANDGGNLGWQNRGVFDPRFEATLDALAPGELSEPVRTAFGWHLIELLETREHDSTQDFERGRIVSLIRREKEQEETARWVRQLRDEAYVEIRL